MASSLLTHEATRNNRIENLPWTEKFRPSSLEDVVAHEHVIKTLERFMENGSMPHLLFYGPPGTGKTTTAKACALHLFGKERVKVNVLELNASDDRGIDVVRNIIKDFCSTISISSVGSSSGSNFKVVILDEADQMTSEAQAALRRMIEKFTKNVRFCIICNYVNKIIPALQSRCTRFRFAPVKKVAMLPRLRMIAEKEGSTFTEDGLIAAYDLSRGDLRLCLNILQSCMMSFNEISKECVYKVTGNATPEEVAEIVRVMISGNVGSSWIKLEELVTNLGISMADLVREVYPVMMAMDLPEDCKRYLLVKLADLEYFTSLGSRETIGLSGLLAAFQLVKEAVTQGKPVKEFLPKVALES